MEFIRGTTLVYPIIRNWSGETKAEREVDVMIGKDGKILPQKLLDLGRKSIYPKDALDPMTKCRKAVERACLDKGTRFMGGYAIPDEYVDEAIKKIDEVKMTYERHLSVFMREFETKRESWLNEEDQKPYRDILTKHVTDKETVSSAFRFGYQVFKLNSVEGFELDEAEISNQIFHELAMDCRGMAKSLLDRKTATTGDTLKKRFDPFVERLNALSFGNSRILKVLDEFRALRDSIPLERIDKDHPKFGQVVTFLKMCSDSETLEQIIDGRFSVTGMINALARQQAAQPVQPISDGDTASVIVPAIPPIVTTVAGAYF
jgi:hypothetical protein